MTTTKQKIYDYLIEQSLAGKESGIITLNESEHSVADITVAVNELNNLNTNDALFTYRPEIFADRIQFKILSDKMAQLNNDKAKEIIERLNGDLITDRVIYAVDNDRESKIHFLSGKTLHINKGN